MSLGLNTSCGGARQVGQGWLELQGRRGSRAAHQTCHGSAPQAGKAAHSRLPNINVGAHLHDVVGVPLKDLGARPALQARQTRAGQGQGIRTVAVSLQLHGQASSGMRLHPPHAGRLPDCSQHA